MVMAQTTIRFIEITHDGDPTDAIEKFAAVFLSRQSPAAPAEVPPPRVVLPPDKREVDTELPARKSRHHWTPENAAQGGRDPRSYPRGEGRDRRWAAERP
jgi:hypothetical protein